MCEREKDTEIRREKEIEVSVPLAVAKVCMHVSQGENG